LIILADRIPLVLGLSDVSLFCLPPKKDADNTELVLTFFVAIEEPYEAEVSCTVLK